MQKCPQADSKMHDTYYSIIGIEGQKYGYEEVCCFMSVLIILKIMITFQNERSVFWLFFH
jgi:hypothetical protein